MNNTQYRQYPPPPPRGTAHGVGGASSPDLRGLPTPPCVHPRNYNCSSFLGGIGTAHARATGEGGQHVQRGLRKRPAALPPASPVAFAGTMSGSRIASPLALGCMPSRAPARSVCVPKAAAALVLLVVASLGLAAAGGTPAASLFLGHTPGGHAVWARSSHGPLHTALAGQTR